MAVVSLGSPLDQELLWRLWHTSSLCAHLFYLPVIIVLAYQEDKVMNWYKCTWKCTKHPTNIVSGSLSLVISSSHQFHGVAKKGEKWRAVVFSHTCHQDVWTEQALGLSVNMSLFCGRDFNLKCPNVQSWSLNKNLSNEETESNESV